MNPRIAQLSRLARQAISRRDGRVLLQSFSEILRLDPGNAEGSFLKGVFFKGQRNSLEATAAFENALAADSGRYDAAVELAELLLPLQENARIVALLKAAEITMRNSPYYLNFSGEIYERIGLHGLAWPLFQAANNIQKDAAPIETNLAGAAAKVGEMEIAKKYYTKLLAENPTHQRNHFELSRLSRAEDELHIEEMKTLLNKNREDGAKNIFLYFALAKEYEDLGQWEQAYHYLGLGNKYAAQQAKIAGYEIHKDTGLVQAIVETNSDEWLMKKGEAKLEGSAPIFVTGLPRTGTTLVERIIGAHSEVESVGESFFLDLAIKRAAGALNSRDVTAEIIRRAAKQSSAEILSDYMSAIGYRRSGCPYFVEKLPLNFLNIGFILKAMPEAKVLILDRKPMDACYAMFKQPYFRFSYDLTWLAEYYLAFDKLRKHWDAIAGDRIIAVSYEALVHNPEDEIRSMISKLGLDFQASCLDFHLSTAASATASFAQIRRRAHTGSVNKWTNLRDYLQPLTRTLEAAGLDVEPYESAT